MRCAPLGAKLLHFRACPSQAASLVRSTCLQHHYCSTFRCLTRQNFNVTRPQDVCVADMAAYQIVARRVLMVALHALTVRDAQWSNKRSLLVALGDRVAETKKEKINGNTNGKDALAICALRCRLCQTSFKRQPDQQLVCSEHESRQAARTNSCLGAPMRPQCSSWPHISSLLPLSLPIMCCLIQCTPIFFGGASSLFIARQRGANLSPALVSLKLERQTSGANICLVNNCHYRFGSLRSKLNACPLECRASWPLVFKFSYMHLANWPAA